MPFSTFNVQDVQAHRETSVVEGVADDSAAQLVELAGGLARDAMAGRAMANLTGAEATSAAVGDDDVYGAYNYEGDEPVSLAIDQDLTRITNARKQGRISSERARSLVNIRLRQAINDNPAFSKELTQRAQQFFDEVGGGSATGAGGNILTPTREEQLEMDIERSNIMDLRAEEMEAQQIGLSVPEYRKRQRERADIQLARDRMQLARDEQQTVAQMNEDERASYIREFNRDLGNFRAGVQMDLMADIGAMIQESGGALSADQRTSINTNIRMQAQEMMSLVEMNAGNMETEEYRRQINSLESWRDNMIGIVNESNLEDLASAVRDHHNIMADLELQKELPVVLSLFRLDSEAGREALNMMADPKRTAAMAEFNPMARFVMDYVSGNNEGTPGMAAYNADIIRALLTGNEEDMERLPGSEDDKNNAVDHAAAEHMAGEVWGGEALEDQSWERLRSVVERQGAVAFNAAATPAAQRKVREDDAKKQNLLNVFDYYTRGVQSAIRHGHVDLSELEIQVKDPAEHLNVWAQQHGDGGDVMSDEYWRQRRYGRRTRGPSIEVSVPAATQRRREGIRGMVGATGLGGALGLGQGMSESFGQVSDAGRAEALADDIQALVRVADTYPDFEIDGTNLRDLLVNRLGIGEIEDMIDPEQAERTDPIPGPFQREEQQVDDSVQDVEFDDIRIAGEESPIGDLEFQQVGEGRPRREVRAQEDVVTQVGDRDTVISGIMSNLERREGRGTNVEGDVPTGFVGVTQAALNSVGMSDRTPEDLSDEEALSVARQYAEQAYDHMHSNMQGFSNAPAIVQEEILDASYNLGFENVTNYPTLNRKLEQGDWLGAMREGLLDTATANGRSMRGLAVRRAENYNRVAEALGGNTISNVEQTDDGVIIYRDSEGREIFRFRARGGRHSDSGVGTLNVP